MSDVIETAQQAAGISLHESCHLLVASMLGGELHGATLDMQRLTGLASYTMPARAEGFDEAVVVCAGPIGQAKFFGHRRWQDAISPSDQQTLVELAETLGEDVDALTRRAGQRARQLLDSPGTWAKVQSLAVQLLERGGRLEFSS